MAQRLGRSKMFFNENTLFLNLKNNNNKAIVIRGYNLIKKWIKKLIKYIFIKNCEFDSRVYINVYLFTNTKSINFAVGNKEKKIKP